MQQNGKFSNMNCENKTNVQWLVTVLHQQDLEYPAQYKKCDKDSMETMWEILEKESNYIRTIKYMQLEDKLKEIKVRVFKEGKFFEWRGNEYDYFYCVYLVNGTVDKANDDKEFEERFKQWNYVSLPQIDLT